VGLLKSAPAGMALLALSTGAWAAGLPVKAWQGSETIPTYDEGPPDINPPFDLFQSGRFNYPYTMRENLTDRRRDRVWRTLNLENEYLKVSVLPDLGGRLWRCIDKVNGKPMFYANPSLKFAQVAYRGAWATFGIEFNFPVSHNWVTSSPVDHALVRNRDGSASIVVANVDLVYGMQWRVALTLQPGRAVLEQATTLYNRSDVRHRFYWWTNAAVEAWDDSELVYPMEFTASHGFTSVDTWPIDASGVDLSRPGNHRSGPVSLFSYGSREPFMGIYHPHTHAGVVHYSDPADLPAKKVWSWGVDADGLDWRRALSDNGSAEVEIQAGLFRNQETYAFLEPQEQIHFTEFWMPVRELGGITRATPAATLRLTREPLAGHRAVTLGLQVNEAVEGGRLVLRDGGRTLSDEPLSLRPDETLLKAFPALPPEPLYTVDVIDASGRVLLSHTEGRLDVVPRDSVTVGPQVPRRMPPPEARTEGDFVELGRSQELEGRLLRAYATYDEGLRRFPGCFELLKASGRLGVGLKRGDEAEVRLTSALSQVSNDGEVLYALGLVFRAAGREDRAREAWEKAAFDAKSRPAALLQLARLESRAHHTQTALERLHAALREDPGLLRAGGMEVALLRRSGRSAEARERLAHWRKEDPTASFLRHEAVLLGAPDAALWFHLAGDPQRVLEVAIDYMELAAWDDALALLGRSYPVGPDVHAEAGVAAPQAHPELAYYRAYCKERLGQDARADFAAASRLPTRYVFPQRAETLPVLRRALEVDPNDATAHFLLGALQLSGGRTDAALAEWERSRELHPRIPTLHRNMGLTLLQVGGQEERAREILAEGATADPTNVEVYLALDQVLGILGRPADERVAALEAYPDKATLPAALVFKLALGLVEVGRYDAAEGLLAGRFFPREEFGTNVRQVYVEVRLQRALALARAGRKAEAEGIAGTLGAEVETLPFTKTGMGAFRDSARVQYLLGELFSLTGNDAEAKRHWEAALERPDSYPHPDAAFAYAAARRLGGPAAQVARTRLETALEGWRNRLVVGTNFPGANATGQGFFLRALGREAEAREKFHEALLMPDKVMSHYLSRAALSVPNP
jgi:tetratricopeptide (TPR) repeat protein